MKENGLTLVEILLAISAGMILLVAIAVFTTRGVNLARENTEQVRITEDARVQLERMSDAVRDARSLDFSTDGFATFPAEVWLQYGDEYDIQFYTNFDEDPEIERVHYFLEGPDLKRGVRDPYNSTASEEIVTIARSVRNQAQNVPLFRYYEAAGETPLSMPVLDRDKARLVEITLVVDVDEGQAPPAATISTIVVPRASNVKLAPEPPSPAPQPSPTPSGGPLPSP